MSLPPFVSMHGRRLGLTPSGLQVDGRTIRSNVVRGHEWFIDAKLGDDGRDGYSPDTALATFAELFTRTGSRDGFKSGDTIYFTGKVREQATTPISVFDVSIIGLGAPRHADDHSEPSGGGYHGGSSAATWMAPASNPTALTANLTVQGQGWRFINFLMASSTTSSAGIKLARNQLSGDSEIDGGHARFYGMRFDACPLGIDVATTGFVGVYDSYFRGCTTTGISSSAGGGGSNGFWDIEGNRFMDNGTHILVPLLQSTVRNNISGKFTTKGFNFTNGSYNSVHGNYLSGDYDAGYVAGTSDDWAGNHSMDITSDEVGAEGLTTAAPVA